MSRDTEQGIYNVISLFSGCGGLDLGLEGGFTYLGKTYAKNPFRVVWANDIDKRTTETEALNMQGINVICGDITTMLDDGIDFPNADVVVGGFPCQDFSIAGNRMGLTVKRGRLYLSMVKVVKQVKPRVFLAENVKGLLTWEDGLAIRTIVEDFKDLGYNVEYRVFNTADYGVPQTRERVIIVGIRKDLNKRVMWPEPTHSGEKVTGLKPWVTLRDALWDIEDEDIQRKLPNWGYSKAKLVPNTQGNTVPDADKPGPTIRAEHHGNIEFHYSLPRRLSVREAARIQSFPDTFKFVKTMTDAYRQLGNAVPPVFAWYLAQMLKYILDKE